MASSPDASSSSISKLSKEEKRRQKEQRKAEKSAAKAAKHVRKQQKQQPSASPVATKAVVAAALASKQAAARPAVDSTSIQSAFKLRFSSFKMAIPPALTDRPNVAIAEMFDTLLMRYVPPLGGVLVAHSDHIFLERSAKFEGDGAFSIVPASAACLVWAPMVGNRLEGTITLSTPSHVSLLIHGTFNASISAEHLPGSTSFGTASSGASSSTADWVFVEDEDAAAEDEARLRSLEAEKPAADEQMKEEAEVEEAMEVDEEDAEKQPQVEIERSLGYWKKRSTGERLGGKDGRVSFVVIGLTIADHQLSLHGSLLPKPFSVPAPTSVPAPARPIVPVRQAPAASSNEQNRRVRFQSQNAEDDDDSDDEDLPAASSLLAAPAAAAAPAPAPASSSSPDKPGKAAPVLIATPGEAEKRGKKRKAGPKREGEASASEGEAEHAKKDKKRKKEKK